MSEILKYLSVRFQATNKTYTFSTTDNSIVNGDGVEACYPITLK